MPGKAEWMIHFTGWWSPPSEHASAVPGAGAGVSQYVARQVNGKVSFYDPVTGVPQGLVGTYRTPAGLAVDSSGSHPIAAFGEDRVYRVDTVSGTQTVLATLLTGSGPFQVAFDPSGNVYVTTTADGNFYLASTAFAPVSDLIVRVAQALVATTFASTNLAAPIFTLADAQGRVLVSNGATAGSVSAFQANGICDSISQSNLFAPNQIAAAPGGGLFVAMFGASDVLLCPGVNNCSVFIDQGPARGTSGVAIAATLTPEPATAVLLPAGLAGLAALRRSRRR